MEVYFLTPNQAYSKLHDLHINHYGCTRSHHNNIINFSDPQKKLLNGVMNKVQQKLPVPAGRIDFVLLDRGVYWDRPFTWGKTMIMVTPTLLKGHTNNELISIFIHEWVHLDQRRNPIKYDRLYYNMGFKRANIDFKQYSNMLFSNPDATRYEWIWRGRYVPFAVMKNCKCHTLIMDSYTGKIHNVEDVLDYYGAFGHTRQLYHPNEIIAHIIEQSLKNDHTN